ncbi:hypothetical protein AB5N19_13387 [Seiridium cardinale]|uniref:Uncharacterized protein n=1 Tax=Seiridium cardinale TaxID=138064 RepID=A0ABR2X599_9PEZI
MADHPLTTTAQTAILEAITQGFIDNIRDATSEELSKRGPHIIPYFTGELLQWRANASAASSNLVSTRALIVGIWKSIKELSEEQEKKVVAALQDAHDYMKMDTTGSANTNSTFNTTWFDYAPGLGPYSRDA